MSVSVIGMKEVLGLLKQVPKQSKFAMAKAINETAKEVQKVTEKRVLPSAFDHLRSRGKPWYKPGNKLGFNIRPWARKDKLEARVGSAAPWLSLHEEGGTKRTSGSLAIPQAELKSKPELVRRAIRPKRIAAKLRSQKRMKVKAGSVRPLTRKRQPITQMPSGQKGLFVRMPNGRIRALYLFEKSARIRKKLGWYAMADKTVEKELPRNFNREFVKAMASAK